MLAAVAIAALSVGACATGGSRVAAVPRPFPGAALPPGAGEPGKPNTGAAEPAAPGPDAAAPNAAAPDAARPFTGREPAPLISTALSFRGIPYRNGGSDPSGFDCSGFVQWVFATHGIRLPREVRDQYRVGRDVDDMKDVKAGDLVFFETVSRGASHVGLAIGGDQFVHAPSSRGVVRVEHLSASYWSRRFVGARRIGSQPIRATK
jgi:cell wall-associated NlpC family hydrolase